MSDCRTAKRVAKDKPKWKCLCFTFCSSLSEVERFTAITFLLLILLSCDFIIIKPNKSNRRAHTSAKAVIISILKNLDFVFVSR